MRGRQAPDKPLECIPGALKALKEFPASVRLAVGTALRLAQQGARSPDAKPLSGFGSADVCEIVVDHSGDTYRTIYTVQFEKAVYVLDAFKKKSKSGIKTPKPDMDRLRERLKSAKTAYAEKYGEHSERRIH